MSSNGCDVYVGKGAGFLAGYNTMPEEEKANYYERALLRFMGKMMFSLTFSMVFWIKSMKKCGYLFVGLSCSLEA
ncbi:DUF3784 domain-containing protein [Bacillus sp. BGMRC 2118]|nr:DUF3784 domain-containing protein [Bacillus sp. BGMRC 2118]